MEGRTITGCIGKKKPDPLTTNRVCSTTNMGLLAFHPSYSRLSFVGSPGPHTGAGSETCLYSWIRYLAGSLKMIYDISFAILRPAKLRGQGAAVSMSICRTALCIGLALYCCESNRVTYVGVLVLREAPQQTSIMIVLLWPSARTIRLEQSLISYIE